MKIKKLFTIVFLMLVVPLQAAYMPIQELAPGQVRFSSKNVEEKIRQAIEKGNAIYIPSVECYQGKYCDGNSLFPESESLPIVKGPNGFVLVDGHHYVIAAELLGINWIPTKEIADLSDCSETTFWEEMEKQGWAYLYNLEGNKQIPPRDFTQLQDDPNRYFAAISARKCGSDGDVSNSIGAEYPLWIKRGTDVPFIEFRIADVLSANHVHYLYEMGDTPDIGFVERARAILVEAHIPDLCVIQQRTHWTEL